MIDPQMIEIYPDCPDCEGTGRQFNPNDGEYYECLRCKGEGWITVEVCEFCRNDERGCRCLEEGKAAA